jgi:transposase
MSCARKLPALKRTHTSLEGYYAIYDAQTKEEALILYQAWSKEVTPEFQAAFGAILTAWRNWQPYILNYFDHRITNAFTESLNNLIRVMNRLGRGYSFEALRAKVLFSRGAYKTVSQKPAFKRQDNLDAVSLHTMAKMFFPNTPESEVINYGVDIDKLVALIEAGEI